MINEFSIHDKRTIEGITSNPVIPEFTADDVLFLDDYISWNRFLVEVGQLFDSYLFNLGSLHNYYELFTSDKIQGKNNFMSTFTFEVPHDIAINALTNNLVSSAVTMIDGMEVFIKQLVKKGRLKGPIESIRAKWTCEAYDKNFIYRFFCVIRNFMQHNHLAVNTYSSGDGITCCFDLEQLISTPHFDMNQKMKKELLAIKKDMLKGPLQHTRLAYTRTVARFHIQVLKLHYQFFEIIENAMKALDAEWESFLRRNPKAIHVSEDESNGMLFYAKGNELHMFMPNRFFDEGFLPIKQRVKEIFEGESAELEKINAVLKPL